MSFGPQCSDKAISILVPAVFLVFMKINLCRCETIMITIPGSLHFS